MAATGPGRGRMKRGLLMLALALFLAATAAWAWLGANRGWTKTSVPVKLLDEVTGIEKVDYRKQFVPGLDLLAAAALAASLAAIAACLMRSKPKS